LKNRVSYRVMASNLAALIIQKHVRNFLEKKKFSLKQQSSIPLDSVKLKYESLQQEKKNEFEFQDYCATLIQACWRGYLFRKKYVLRRFPIYTEAAISIQTAWKFYRFKKTSPRTTSESEAIVRIQRFWRSYTNTKIFEYYRDLIKFKMKGNPKELLKTISPAEANLIDKASNVHVRFRLGGENFPPLIYYKIYIHSGVCDVNSFAPRDYSAMKRFTGKSTVNIKLEASEAKELREGWYERYDNNGWRPIIDNLLVPFDKVELKTSSKPAPFHHDRSYRQKIQKKNRRKRKIKWLKQLYEEGKNLQEIESQEVVVKEVPSFDESIENLEQLPFEDPSLLDLSEEDFESYVNGLMKWSETLDFDKYMENWFLTATSAPAEIGDNIHQPITL